nr:uncharacterized protein LOC109742072 [Aegilops tauschii subsp. strangulata]
MKAREDAFKVCDAKLEQSAKAQAIERGRLEELEQKVKAEEAELVAKAKVLAEDRTAFALLKKRSLVSGIGPMAEEEARVLSSAALTHFFSHLHLRDPAARLDELLEPVDDERYAATAAAVRGQASLLAAASHVAVVSGLKRRLAEAEEELGQVKRQLQEKQGLAEAEGKAFKEQAARKMLKARVNEVQQELQDEVKKCETLERDSSVQEAELAKARQNVKTAQNEAQGTLQEIQKTRKIAAGSSQWLIAEA